MSLTGSGPDDPQRVGVPIADLLAGMYGAYGVLAALHERDRTGVGQVVRTSLLAAVVGVHAFQGTRWTVAGEVGRAQGNHHPSIAPTGCSTAATASVQIAVRQRGPVAAVLRRLRPRPASRRVWPPTASGSATGERVIAIVEGVFADWDAEPLLARLAEVGIPAGQGPHASTRSTSGTRPPARACSSTSSTRRSGR